MNDQVGYSQVLVAAIARGRCDAAVLDMQQHASPPDLRKLRRDVPRALTDTVMEALSKAREARWQTASDMRRALLPYAPW